MHEAIEKPRNMASIGFAAVARPAVVAAHLFDQPGPVVGNGLPDSGRRSVRPGHVVQTVEGEHERVITVIWQFLGSAIDDFDVVEPEFRDACLGTLHGQARQLIPMEGRAGVRVGQRRKSHRRATANIGHQCACGKPIVDSLQRRHDRRHQAQTGPRPEHALGLMHARGTLAVIGQPCASAERLGKVVHQRRVWRRPERAGSEQQAVFLPAEDHRADGGQLKTLPVIGREQVGRRVAPEPLAQPARLQSSPFSQLLSAERPTPSSAR